VTITPEMVGQTVAVVVFEEHKNRNGRLTKEQSIFKDLLEKMGGIYRVIRGD
jgi:hypothetical protein